MREKFIKEYEALVNKHKMVIATDDYQFIMDIKDEVKVNIENDDVYYQFLKKNESNENIDKRLHRTLSDEDIQKTINFNKKNRLPLFYCRCVSQKIE